MKLNSYILQVTGLIHCNSTDIWLVTIMLSQQGTWPMRQSRYGTGKHILSNRTCTFNSLWFYHFDYINVIIKYTYLSIILRTASLALAFVREIHRSAVVLSQRASNVESVFMTWSLHALSKATCTTTQPNKKVRTVCKILGDVLCKGVDMNIAHTWFPAKGFWFNMYSRIRMVDY